MTCSTCDGYQLVPGEDGMLEDCPDCHANQPRAWCPVHSIRLDAHGRCARCIREATRAAEILNARAAEAAANARTVAA